MNFYTARDLRTIPKNIWNTLSSDGEVIITNNGKPTALMLNISETNFNEVVNAVRQAKAMIHLTVCAQKLRKMDLCLMKKSMRK